MVTTIHDSCAKIMKTIRCSSLNFSCQESPYSIYITIRKSWSKLEQGPVDVNLPPESVQQVHVDSDRSCREATNKMSEEINSKVEAAVADVTRRHKATERLVSKKDDEIIALKNSIKTCTLDNEKLKGEIKNLQKVLKGKDKEIYNLETFKLNNLESVKNAKSNAKEHKEEKEKLIKLVKILEKKIETFERKRACSTENNNNNIEHVPVSQNNTSSSNDVAIGKSGSTASFPKPSISNCEVAQVATISPLKPSLASPTPPASMSPPISQVQSCEHQPQCILRQPKPPPPQKCSILVHNGSKYHEHFLTSVPARYGPHENCMAVAYENYGCSDCIWFKKWGELHGYPDLWPLKYIKSGTYGDHLLLPKDD